MKKKELKSILDDNFDFFYFEKKKNNCNSFNILIL